jgi:hypothetical protein
VSIQFNQPNSGKAGGRYAAGPFLRLPARRPVLPHSDMNLEPDMVNEWLTTAGAEPSATPVRRAEFELVGQISEA